MRARSTTASPGLRARLTAVGCAGLTMVAAVSIAACAGSAPRATLPKLSPGASAPASAKTSPSHSTATRTHSPSTSSGASHSSPAGRSGSPGQSTHSAPSRARTHTPHPFPNGAPATGGGGTAGLEDVWLLGLGAAAIVAGVGCIAGVAYHRLRAGVR